MLVKNWMSKDLITVDVNDSMMNAIELLKEYDIRTLPVMKRGDLVGIVTDRDLKRASASDASTLEIHELLYLVTRIKIKEIMTKDPITIPFDYTLEEAAEILLRKKISGVPVVDHKGRIEGMITDTDLFRAMLSLTSLTKKGIQFGFQLEDRSGSIKEVADIIRKYEGRMASILSSYDRAPKGYRRVYIRMYGLDPSKIDQLKEEFSEKATLLYMVDLCKNKREIYSL